MPYPTHSFASQVIIVTGSNTGLGLEAARHFVRLGAAKVIITSRSITRAQEAADDIDKTTNRPGVAEGWELDLASYASVKTFAARAETELPRLDVLLNNAASFNHHFEMAEGNELSITVNVISPLLLSLLLLPKLRQTSITHNTRAVVTVVTSFLHALTSFPESKSENILVTLADEKQARMQDRYNVNKLMEILAVRELADQVTQSTKGGQILISAVNPGSAKKSTPDRETAKGFDNVVRKMVQRSTEEGSRTLVHAAQGDVATHGQYLNDCKIGRASAFVSFSGDATQHKLWSEMGALLERVQPGIMGNI
ncbi:hypothetical protein GGR57DRAFT_515507 [Xylariaceae sp. FL1272]|nr:hypothetical protein GGR57DRAFT_515507 [Xylariaceae sp. FL1272]